MLSSDTVTWIGTIFSILGAAIAIWQAKQAVSAAKRAEQMRDEIAGKSAHTELSALDAMLTAACNAMDKYGPGAQPVRRRGASPDSDAATVRAFTAAMDRHHDLLAATFGGPCNAVRDRINGQLDQFAAAANDAARVQAGKEVYSEIIIFSGNMKRAIDAKVFGRQQPKAAALPPPQPSSVRIWWSRLRIGKSEEANRL